MARRNRFEKIIYHPKSGRPGDAGKPLKVEKYVEDGDVIVGVTYDKQQAPKAVILPLNRAVQIGKKRFWIVREGELVAWSWHTTRNGDGPTPALVGPDGKPLEIIGGAVDPNDAQAIGIVNDAGRPIRGITPRVIAAYIQTQKMQEWLQANNIKTLEVLLLVACVISGGNLINGFYQDNEIKYIKAQTDYAAWLGEQNHAMLLRLTGNATAAPATGFTPTPGAPGPVMVPGGG